MKNIVYLILGVFILSLLTGCGSEEKPKEIRKKLAEQGYEHLSDGDFEKAIEVYTELLNENEKKNNKVLNDGDKMEVEARIKDMNFFMEMKKDWEKNKNNYNLQQIEGKLDRIQNYLKKSRERVLQMDSIIRDEFVGLLQEINKEANKRDNLNIDNNNSDDENNINKEYDENEANDGLQKGGVVIP
ncbi:TPA: hypothetical protein ACGXNJ_001579 [Bacillus cereus]|uniref:hypothetical protein n=1 Tax=Bacillus anthracis TaxID=1392 RepID=UPI003731B465